MKAQQIVIGQTTTAPQGDIETTCAMTFGEDELIVGLQVLVEKDQQGVELRKVAPEMTHSAVEVHVDEASTRPSGDLFHWYFFHESRSET
jgi:hypothetical protein